MLPETHRPSRAQRVRLLAKRCSTPAARDELVDYAIKADETIDTLLELLEDYRVALASLNDAVEAGISRASSED